MLEKEESRKLDSQALPCKKDVFHKSLQQNCCNQNIYDLLRSIQIFEKKNLCTYIHTKFPHRIKKDIPCTSAENVSADAYLLNAVPRIKGLLFHSRHLKKKKPFSCERYIKKTDHSAVRLAVCMKIWKRLDEEKVFMMVVSFGTLCNLCM